MRASRLVSNDPESLAVSAALTITSPGTTDETQVPTGDAEVDELLTIFAMRSSYSAGAAGFSAS